VAGVFATWFQKRPVKPVEAPEANMKKRCPANNLGFRLAGSALALIICLAAASANAQGDHAQPGPGIGFGGLTGTNNAPYHGHTEGSFAVTTTAGSWFEAHAYGNPIPSIYDGPINSPGTGAILITDSAGPFTLSSFQFSSNNGDSTYDVQGYFGQALAFEETGTLPGSFPTGFGFQTNQDTHASVPIDGLVIEVIPGPGVTSINLDNIMVTTIPEPVGIGLLTAGLACLCLRRTSVARNAAQGAQKQAH
jgi:hypothetical protein